MSKPDWNDAPDWAKFLVKGSDAVWLWSSHQPKWREDYGIWDFSGCKSEFAKEDRTIVLEVRP